MARKNRDVEGTLLKKFDFQKSKRGKDHRWLSLKLLNLPPVVTHFSHGKQDIGDKLWSIIAKQLRVKRDFLDAMIDCTKSREDYYEHLRNSPLYLPGRTQF